MGIAGDEESSFFVDINDEATKMKFEALDLGMEPVNGIVQPPVVPPEDKPHRNTDALQYMLKHVLKAILKHRFAWPFMDPVNSVMLNAPDYHRIIKYPMDLSTIRKRLENHYYYDVNECVTDFQLMFYNCFLYNNPGDDITLMAHDLEKVLAEKMKYCPEEENEIPPNRKTVFRRTNGEDGTISHFEEDSSISDQSSLTETATVPKSQRCSLTFPTEKAETPGFSHKSTLKTSANIKFSNQSTPKNSMALARSLKTPGFSPIGSSHKLQYKKDIKQRKSTLVSPVKYNAPEVFSRTLSNQKSSEMKKKHSTDSARASTFQKTSKPKRKRLKQMDYCEIVLKNLLSEKHGAYAWPFYEPVSEELAKFYEFNNKVQQPMDLQTVKTNLQKGNYTVPSEFAAHIRLIFNNCYNYNKPQNSFVEMAKLLQTVFEKQYAKMPNEPVLSPSASEILPERLTSSSESSSSSSSDSEDGEEKAAQLQNLQKELKKITKEISQLTHEMSSRRKRKKRAKKPKCHLDVTKEIDMLDTASEKPAASQSPVIDVIIGTFEECVTSHEPEIDVVSVTPEKPIITSHDPKIDVVVPEKLVTPLSNAFNSTGDAFLKNNPLKSGEPKNLFHKGKKFRQYAPKTQLSLSAVDTIPASVSSVASEGECNSAKDISLSYLPDIIVSNWNRQSNSFESQKKHELALQVTKEEFSPKVKNCGSWLNLSGSTTNKANTCKSPTQLKLIAENNFYRFKKQATEKKMISKLSKQTKTNPHKEPNEQQKQRDAGEKRTAELVKNTHLDVVAKILADASMATPLTSNADSSALKEREKLRLLEQKERRSRTNLLDLNHQRDTMALFESMMKEDTDSFSWKLQL